MKTEWTFYAAMLGLLAFAPAGRAEAQQTTIRKDNPRAVMVVTNQMPGFYVRVDVDHPDHVYYEGQEMRVTVSSERAGHLYLIYNDAQGNLTLLFPNIAQQDNAIPAGENVVTVPGLGADFRLAIGPPFGRETLKAIVSERPLKDLEVKQLTQQPSKVSTKDIKAAFVELKGKPEKWGEHYVDIETRPRRDQTDQSQTGQNQTDQTQVGPSKPEPRRVGLFIGISDFADGAIRDLKVSDRDAQAMADAMRSNCRLDEALVLTNQQATLANIQQAVCQQLAAQTHPGDTVFIFWSGHGARCADTNGDEKDGYDEYLVPQDGRLDDVQSTMLIDDTFGRWIQELDGRKVVVILDTCHSGGQNAQEKSVFAKSLGVSQPPVGGVRFDFLDGDLQRTKDIGQKETALIASSMAAQVSFERREGDLSTLTYYLVEQLGGGGPLTLAAAFDAVKNQVAQYVETNFPGTTQTPVLIDNTTSPIYLRP